MGCGRGRNEKRMSGEEGFCTQRKKGKLCVYTWVQGSSIHSLKDVM